MKYIDALCVFALSFGVVFCAACFAYAETSVGFVSNPLWLSTARTTEGESVQVSTVITKQSADPISGTVTFYSNGTSIGATDFSLPTNVGGVVVAVSFVASTGTHLVSAKITKVVSESGSTAAQAEVKAEETLVVDPDNDRDKIADANDPDDDNDGVSDSDEKKSGTDPLKKEGAAPAVAGAATASASGIVDSAKNIAGPIGESVFQKTESFRLNSADYFDTKLKEAEAAKQAKQASASDLQSIDERAEHGFKPIGEQLKDTSGLLEGLKVQAYKIGKFIFGNVYAFYILGLLIIFWLLRKLWRRHSLD